MIEVTITQADMLRALDDKQWAPGALVGARIGCVLRELLAGAGIPLRHTFDLSAEICPLAGRLEWFEDCWAKSRVYRWYPPEEAVTECPL